MKLITYMKPIEYFELKADEAHVWITSLADAHNDIVYLTSLLSEDEYERANSYRFTKDRNQYIITRAILRCLLAKYLKQKPNNIEFVYGLWGKPYLLQKNTLYFNVSHSKDYALYAIARNYEVGIDLEYIDKTLELKNTISSVLSPVELENWKKLKSNNKTEKFFKLWTCKEAYLKALGKGWLENSNEMPIEIFCILKNQKIAFLNGKITYPYIFECIPGYASALYINGPPLKLIQSTWDREFII